MTYKPTGVTAGTAAAGDDSRIGAGGPSYGLNPQNFKRWRKALTRVRTGQADAKILTIGDSITFGEGATAGTNPIYRNCWPKRLQELLNSYHVPASVGLSTGGTGLPVADTRFTLGSGWTYDTPNFGFANVGIAGAAGAAGTMTFAPTHACNKVDVYYSSGSQWSSCSVSIDGGATSTISSTGGTTATVGKVTLSLGSVGTGHTIALSAPTTPGGFNKFFLIGMEAYDDTTSSVRVALSGAALTKASDWANGPTPGIRSLGCITAYAPHLAIINLGVNDASAGVSQATYISNIGTIISTVQAAGGDVLLTSVVPTGDGRISNEILYQSALSSLSTTYGCGVVDILQRWVDYTTSNTYGYYFDTIHPTEFGYADMAQAFFNALKTI